MTGHSGNNPEAPDPQRKSGEPLGPNCEHGINEDCINCTVCGRCRETVDEADICDDCRSINPT